MSLTNVSMIHWTPCDIYKREFTRTTRMFGSYIPLQCRHWRTLFPLQFHCQTNVCSILFSSLKINNFSLAIHSQCICDIQNVKSIGLCADKRVFCSYRFWKIYFYLKIWKCIESNYIKIDNKQKFTFNQIHVL